MPHPSHWIGLTNSSLNWAWHCSAPACKFRLFLEVNNEIFLLHTLMHKIWINNVRTLHFFFAINLSHNPSQKPQLGLWLRKPVFLWNLLPCLLITINLTFRQPSSPVASRKQHRRGKLNNLVYTRPKNNFWGKFAK